MPTSRPVSTSSMAILSISTPAAQQELKAKLEQLTRETQATKREYTGVNNELKESSGLAPLHGSWSALNEAYTKHIWESKDTATLLSTTLEQLASTIIPLIAGDLGQIPPEEAIGALGSARTESQSIFQKAKAIVISFETLQSAISQFKAQQQDFISQQDEAIRKLASGILDLNGLTQPHRTRIAELQGQATRLDDEIAEVEEEISKLGFFEREKKKQLQVKLAKLKVDRAKLDPLIQLEQDEINKYQNEINVKQADIDEKRADLSTIDKQSTAVNGINNTRLQNIIKQLPVLQEIWQGTDNDIEELLNYVQKEDQGEVPTVLVSYQKAQAGVYDIIREACLAYHKATAS